MEGHEERRGEDDVRQGKKCVSTGEEQRNRIGWYVVYKGDLLYWTRERETERGRRVVS